jgi:hypothetical protein
MPTARYALSAETGPDGRIYAIGGTSNANGPTPVVEAYDPATDTWTSAPLPFAVSDFASAVGENGTIYVIGGSDSHGAAIASVEAYNTSTNTWSPATPMPSPNVGLAAAVGLNGTIYAVGGAVPGQGIANALTAFDPSATGSDTSRPTIDLTTPAAGATYTQGQLVNAAFSCADETGGSGIASCVGTVPTGSPIDTSTVGDQTAPGHAFTVNASDVAGNTSTVTRSYSVIAKPDTVTGVTVTYGDGTVTVNWPAPNANGSPISKYLVTASRPGAPDVTQEALGGTLSSTFASLSHCLPFSFSVKAVNEAGTGDASSAVNNVIPAPATTVQVGEASGTTKDVLYEPRDYRTVSEQCTRVTWQFKSTNVKTHTVTERSAGTAGLGVGGAALFDSGQVVPGGQYTSLLMGAGFYQYKSTVDGTSPSLLGSVSMPVNVTPATGPKTSPFTIRWAQAPMPGYSFTIQYVYKKATANTFGNTWTTWGSNLTSASGTFTPPPKDPAGTYLFRARIKNTTTGKQGGWSYTLAPSSGFCACALTTS